MSRSHDGAELPALQVTYEDDPRVVAAAATEDYSGHVVPHTARVGRFSLMMAFWAVLSALFYFYLSVSISQVVGSVNTIIGMVAAVALYGVVNAVLTRISIRGGVTVAMMSRGIFGSIGASIVTLIFGATAVYYAVFEGSIISVALQRFFAPGSDIRIWYLLVVLYALPLVLKGVQAWLDKINGVLLPFFAIGCALLVVGAIDRFGVSSEFLTVPDPGGTSVPGWLWAICIYTGVFVNMMFTVDYARFGRPRDTAFHATVSFGFVFYAGIFVVSGLLGLFLLHTVFPGQAATETGVADAILSVGGAGGLILIIISQTRINTANYYLASTNLESSGSRLLGLRWSRLVWVGITGVLVFGLMLTNVFSYLLTALAWQGVVIVAWVSIVLTHAAARRGERHGPEFRPGRVRRFLPGTWALLLASVSGIALTELGTDGAWYQATAPLLTAVIATVAYLVGLGLSRTDFGSGRGADPRAEVDDVWAARIACHVCEMSYTALEMDRDPSAGGRAICAVCAEGSRAFLEAAHADARGTDVSPQGAEDAAALRHDPSR